MMVWPKTYERYRLVLREPLLVASGFVSRRDGTMNIMLTHAEVLAGSPPAVPGARSVEGSPGLPKARSWR